MPVWFCVPSACSTLCQALLNLEDQAGAAGESHAKAGDMVMCGSIWCLAHGELTTRGLKRALTEFGSRLDRLVDTKCTELQLDFCDAFA